MKKPNRFAGFIRNKIDSQFTCNTGEQGEYFSDFVNKCYIQQAFQQF